MKANIVLRIFFIFLFVAPFFLNAECLKEGDKVELTGVVKKELFYGPPTFGENKKTDSKEYYWILHLNNPMSCVTDVNTDIDDWNTAVQLDFLDPATKSYSRSLKTGMYITVDGKIQIAIAPTDNQAITIVDITSIKNK